MKAVLFITCLVALYSCNQPIEKKTSIDDEVSYELVKSSDVEWTHLNPKRGDLAPQAGTLWGDRNGTEATGFLLKPNEGFSSPPHIHNVSYRGVVISGLLHNDDPSAAKMWMPAGSFWTQPKGEVHITAAEGKYSLAYIEIEEGPYLVLPKEERFDSGERPVNMDQTNIVWLNASDIEWLDVKEQSIEGPKVAFLWRDSPPSLLNGTLLKIPVGFKGAINNQGSSFKSVIIKGGIDYKNSSLATKQSLDAGSYFASDKGGLHLVSNNSNEEVILYVRSSGDYTFKAL